MPGQEYANIIKAMATVLASASGPTVTPTYEKGVGFNVGVQGSPSGFGAHTATGVYVLSLDTPLPLDTIVQLTPRAESLESIAIFLRNGDVNSITVLTSIAGVASDAVSFCIEAKVLPNN